TTLISAGARALTVADPGDNGLGASTVILVLAGDLNQGLAGAAAVPYGFQVSGDGAGSATFTIGSSNRAAFDLPPTASTTLTLLDILRIANAKSKNGLLYDLDGSGTISSFEKSLRSMANNVFAAINDQGGM